MSKMEISTSPPSPEQIAHAYRIWLQTYEHVAADESVAPFLRDDIKKPTKQGWLRTARCALLLSGSEMAGRLGISRAAYAKFEKNEVLGSITLDSLQRAAEAMDCELVYAIRPKKRVRFSDTIWASVLTKALPVLKKRSSPPHMRGNALAAVVKTLLQDSRFRRQNNWTERK